MQKKIIALAVAGLASTAAFAQTNVTIYGIADAGFLYMNNGASQDWYGIASGVLAGSRLGFRGTEDLGNGVKAVFVLEQGFSIDTGEANGSASPLAANGTTASMSFQRQAYVGLDTKAGAVTLGRQYAPGYGYASGHDALVGSLVSPQHILSSYAGATIAPNSSARWNNTLKVATPNLGGFEGQLVYRFGEQLNNTDRAEGYALGLKYAGGPVSVAYAFHHTESSTTGVATTGPLGLTVAAGAVAGNLYGAATTNPASQNEHGLFGSVDLKVVKLIGSYQMQDWDGAGARNGSKTAISTLGAIVPVGKGNLHVGTGYMDLDGNRNGSSGSGVSHTLAYTHGLSKRTTLYTGVNYTDLSFNARAQGYTAVGAIGGVAGGATANAANSHTLPSGAVVRGGDSVAFTAGINHAF